MRMGGGTNGIKTAIALLAAVCTAFFWVIAPANAQQTVLVEPPAPLLPATLGKLARIAEGDSGDGLGQLDAAGVTAQDKAVLNEDGLKRFAKSDYGENTSKEPRATIAVFSFRDASGAISAYDYFRRDGMRAEKLGDEAAANADEEVLRGGINVVIVTHSRLRREEASSVAGQLIDRLPKAHGTAGISPLLPALLPPKGLDTDSVKYALGPAGYTATNGVLPSDAIGFDKNGEAVTAKYRNGGTLTLLLYPTPQIAGDRARAAENALAGAKIRREGPLVIVASGTWPAGAAQKMVDDVHLRTDVSFDRPMPLEFHTEIRKTYSLLQAVAAFCGLGALAAIVLGLFFGGGRAFIRVLQGKPAYTEPEFLHIDLRGRPHKIRTGADAGPEA
jgi:hypothetical protein